MVGESLGGEGGEEGGMFDCEESEVLWGDGEVCGWVGEVDGVGGIEGEGEGYGMGDGDVVFGGV